MKKTDVYVVVDTPKKAKKLKNLLDMFGEKHFAYCHDFDFEDCVGEVVHFWGDAYFTYCSENNLKSKTKVSIKELRNILAKEHLRPGDVCLFDDRKGFKSIGVFDEYSEEYKDFLVSKVPGEDSVRYGFYDFIRYATEEEKALLSPVDNFTDSDIAIIERLHDALLDNHGYSLESKLLTDARMLANKIKSNIK